jgi:hypothetical protein
MSLDSTGRPVCDSPEAQSSLPVLYPSYVRGDDESKPGKFFETMDRGFSLGCGLVFGVTAAVVALFIGFVILATVLGWLFGW